MEECHEKTESQILVVPSRMESMPIVIAEVFYLGVPVVAFDVGEVSELVRDGVNGRLARPGNEEELLAHINELLDDRQQAQKMGQNGHDSVMESMTQRTQIPKYERFYKNLLS